jgi:hypothetical protein
MKYQERQDRAKALEILAKAKSIAGTRTMRRENGEVVPCVEMADYQIARTYVATPGLIESQRALDFIRTHPQSPLARDAYLDLGRMFFTGDEGIEVYGRMSERFPHDPELASRMAEFIIMMNRSEMTADVFDLAVRMTENALRVEDPSAAARLAKNLAQLRFLKGDEAGAAEAYGPEFLDAQVAEAAETMMAYAELWLARNKNTEKAWQAAEAALRLRPEETGLKRRAAHLYLLPPARMDKALELFGPDHLKRIATSLKDLYSYFSFWTERKQNEASAMEALDRILALKPESIYYRQASAAVLLRAGRQDRALEVFGPAFLESRAGDPNALYEFGTFWLSKNTILDQAVPALVKSLRTVPKAYSSHYFAAQALLKAGRPDDALAVFGPEFLKANQSDFQALTMYAQFWLLTAKSNTENALEALDAAAQIASPRPSDRAQLAFLFIQTKQQARAEEVYGPKLLDTLGDDFSALMRYASFWQWHNKNLFSALEAARRASRAAPENPAVWGTLAEVCEAASEPGEGLAAAEKACRLSKSKSDRERFEAVRLRLKSAVEKK